MCCRLQLDLRELLKRGNGLFGSAEMTGSIGVVTINMARLGYLYKGNSELLYSKLDELLDIAKSTLAVSYTHLRAHETVLDLVCRLLLKTKKHKQKKKTQTCSSSYQIIGMLRP